ncbi:lipopolysaccharide biosynthesis protein [Thermomonospora umbrina]|uniref:O-antigen/teichoic acid export membrane protein n=1 Tax=Thermomonospora umbrina TaxID=111806 RepID=A0A3D9SNZ0_9ACTN|nr:oligosaccharide flippase family protein [Thermomonospora umbrina]REE96160.1 O-antigen/teichoic acid export membrane protein [Thermomonospora umbrina]
MTVRAEPASGGRQGHLREFARGGLIGLAGSVVAAAAGFVLTAVVARTLGPARTGVFFSVVALFMILTEVTELGADTGLVRCAARLRALGRIAEVRRVLAASLLPVLAVGVLTGSAVFAAAPWLAGLLADAPYRDEAETFLRLCAPFLAVSAARNVALSGTRGLGDMTSFTWQANVLTPVSRPLLILAVTWLGYGASTVMLVWSVPIGVTFVVAVLVLWRLVRRLEREPVTTPATPREPGEPSAVREFWGFSGLRGVAAVLEIAVVWLGVPLVAAMASSHDAGVYATLGRFITTGTLVLAATRIAVGPQIAGLLARKERHEAEELNMVATAWVVAASWPLYLALAVFGPFVLTLFGDDFADGADALAILAVTMAVVLATGNVQTVLLMGGKSSWNLLDKAIVVVVMLVAHVALVPSFGVVGGAVAWSIAMLLDGLLAVVQVRYLMGVRLRTRTLAPVMCWAVLWFGGLGLLLRALLGTSAPVFALYLVTAGAGYGLALYRQRRVLHVDVMTAALRKGRSS